MEIAPWRAPADAASMHLIGTPAISIVFVDLVDRV